MAASAEELGDIVVTHSALNTVAEWMGISDPSAVLDRSGADALDMGQRQGLGLGAKYVPHHKGVLMSKADASLSRSLRRSTGLPVQPSRHPLYGLVGAGKPKPSTEEGSASDGEGEEGRGSRTFNKSSRQALATRAQLLTSAKAAKRKGKKQRAAQPG